MVEAGSGQRLEVKGEEWRDVRSHFKDRNRDPGASSGK